MSRVHESTQGTEHVLKIIEEEGVWYLVPRRIPKHNDDPAVYKRGVRLQKGADYVWDEPFQWFWRVRLIVTPVDGDWFSIEYDPVGE